MNIYDESHNDGTIIIWNELDRPTQGTWIAEDEDKTFVTAKGIFRWQAKNRITGESEKPGMVRQAAFGREMTDILQGEIFPIKEIGDETCRLNGQTTLFSVKDPAAAIRHDNRSLKKRTALDLVPRQTKRKIEAGVSPSLLMEEMAPWKLMTTYHGDGIRSIVYGSHLVPAECMPTIVESAKKALALALEAAGLPPAIYDPGSEESWFMLGSVTADRLAMKANAQNVDQMIGSWFLISRDPALPNATGLYPARFAGIMDWDNGRTEYQEGVWINPTDSRWKAAQGDFDGDSASVFVPSKYLQPREPEDKYDLRTAETLYKSDRPADQMIQALKSNITRLLGPTILGTAKLFERALDLEYRETSTTVAQAAVDAKKHSVDVDQVKSLYEALRMAITEGERGGSYPYLASFTNLVKQARGNKAKVTAWKQLYEVVQSGMWDRNGTPIEKALCERIRLLNQLFVDTEFFRTAVRAELPKSMKLEARRRASCQALTVVEKMTEEYVSTVRMFQEEEDLGTEEEREGHRSLVRDMLRRKQSAFRLGAVNGDLDGEHFTPEDARFALLAAAPARLAARYVPAETFESAGRATSVAVVNLFGKAWSDGDYKLDDIDPIPSCRREVDRLLINAALIGATHVKLQVVSDNPTAKSVRCALTIVEPEVITEAA
jgi:hypothetical protein